jgi:hypothetical protein
VASGGWKTASPEEPGEGTRAGCVSLEEVRLLATEDEFERRTSQEALSAFIREAVRLAEGPLGGSGTRLQVLAQFTCRPDGHDVQMAYQGDAPDEGLQEYYEALVAAEPLPVSDGELAFQVELVIEP